MALNRLGDIPGARFGSPIQTHASVASNGANARLGQVGPFEYGIRVTSAWWTPTGADQAGTSTASYRRITVINGGVSGTATAILASINLTATRASLAPVAMTVDTTATVAAGAALVFSQATVGAASATNTQLEAGQLNFSYEVL